MPNYSSPYDGSFSTPAWPEASNSTAAPNMIPTSSSNDGFPFPDDPSLWYPGADPYTQVEGVCQWCGSEEMMCGCHQQAGSQGNNAGTGDERHRGSFEIPGFGGQGSQLASERIWATDHHMVGMTGQQIDFTGLVNTASDSRHGIPPEMHYTSTFSSEAPLATFNEGHNHRYEGDASYSTPLNTPHTSNHGSGQSIESQISRVNVDAIYPMLCEVPNCGRKKLIRDAQSHRAHVRNVHSKYMFCPEPDCHTITPFTNTASLNRHYDAIHRTVDKSYVCTRSTCRTRVKAWVRKDKLQAHNRKYHSSVVCQICANFFDNEEELIEHTHAHLGGPNYPTPRFQAAYDNHGGAENSMGMG